MKSSLVAVLFLCSWQLVIAAEPELVFASGTEGGKLLAIEDEFTKRLSAFDLKARIGSEKTPELGDFLEFVGKSAMDWPDEERARILKSWARLKPKLDRYRLIWPERIQFIRTSGEEEGGAAYTRGTSIVFHPGSVRRGRGLDGLLTHELFHVISRHNPKLRDQLYAIIGFTPCGEVAFPKSLKDLKMTNPDAPVNQHLIKLGIDGVTRPALPVLVARGAYDPERAGDFMSYLTVQFLVVEEMAPGKWVPMKKDDGSPYVASPLRVKSYREQIGDNTGYTIHPEEIMAENFRLLVTQERDVRTPEILEKMKKILGKLGK